MKLTLYEQAKEVEKKIKSLDSSQAGDVTKLQTRLFQNYEANPILVDAIKGRQTIEESLAELSSVNKGINKILPWRKNPQHNKRVEQIGELISEPRHLQTSGMLFPDNLITTGVEITAFMFTCAYLGLDYLLMPTENADPVAHQQKVEEIKVLIPTAISTVAAPLVGMIVNLARFNQLPVEQATYLDTKIQEIYRK